MAGESKSYPKKYWWVVLVALPVGLALVGILPQLIGRSGREDSGGTQVRIDGDNNFVNTGNLTIVNNIPVIAQEYQKQTGQPLADHLRELIEQAVAAAKKNDHATSVRLYEQIASQVPVPSIYNNLGVEYAKNQNIAASQKAFNQAIEKDATNQTARKNLAVIASSAGRSPTFASGGGVVIQNSAAPTIQVDAFRHRLRPGRRDSRRRCRCGIGRWHLFDQISAGAGHSCSRRAQHLRCAREDHRWRRVSLGQQCQCERGNARADQSECTGCRSRSSPINAEGVPGD